MTGAAQAIEALLSPAHLGMLRSGSGISDDVILARGYRTVTDPDELEVLGFAPAQRKVPGLLLPLWTTDGSNGLAVYRPDKPRVWEDRKRRNADGSHPCKELKYELPKGSGSRLDCPPVCRPSLGDPAVPLWLTEGQKKADALASRGCCAVALLGVWNWRGKNAVGGVAWLADWDRIALNGREVRIVFDSDLSSNPGVRAALERLTENLQRSRAHVAAVFLPPAADGGKQGVDDWLAAGHTVAELEGLVTAPRPAPKAAAAVVELLDVAPLAMRRPLQMLGARACAATWVHARVTRTESLNGRGEVVKHTPPLVTTEQRLIVVRDDGRAFADGKGAGDAPLDELGGEVHLTEIPPADRLWTAAGVRAYRAGRRPVPAEVFGQVVDVVDRFIDFDRSLGPQRTMAEAVACYTLATWFLDAFTVTGFLWPNGDRGSGKTQLLTVIAELGYLGQVILSGGSFASLRDLADYGACLAFDDAEGLSDPKRTDPDKRALLLAGNRRGNTVPLKELQGDKTWRTRYVNTFCPRMFSATELPDPILASRTIVVPLIRTGDRRKANADPLQYGLWPHERRALLDDLWALGLSRLPELQGYEERVNGLARLQGRNLEPWRALLAVALWLDDQGVSGLWGRMEGLSVAYQSERPALETDDFTVLTIRALCARCASLARCARLLGGSGDHEFTSEEVKDEALVIAAADDLSIDPVRITAVRVGLVFRKMRLAHAPRPGGHGSRKWKASLDDLRRLTVAYGLPLPSELQVPENVPTQAPAPPPQPGTPGTPGSPGTPAPEPELEVQYL